MTQTPMQKAARAMTMIAPTWDDEVSMAKLTAALASLEADGWKLMPRDATEGMIKAAMADEKPCVFRPWFGDDYGARCETCGASKRGMMANIDLQFECKAKIVVQFPTSPAPSP